MATVHEIPARRNTPVTRYALLTVGTMEIEGTAQLVNGTGYLFRKDGERRAILVAWNDPNLLLFGLVEAVAAQRAADDAAGGLAALVCHPEWRLNRER
jgi:hypothetical protein